MARNKQIKSKMEKYTVNDFHRDFPSDKICLEWLKNYRYPEGIFCKVCGKVTKHHLMTTRRSYSCQECGHHIHPTAGTIFHKSTTALTTWFRVIFLMASTRCGISAKEVGRQTGVTYKTAWRMCKLIRTRLDQKTSLFDGSVEADEGYFGGAKKGGKSGRGSENKTAVLGIVERSGRIQATVVPNVSSGTLEPIIEGSVKKGTIVYTDEFGSYNWLGHMGYRHKTIRHKDNVYVTGNIHTQTIDGFWGNVKNGIKGVYHNVSPKYLQHYLNEYQFRYNHRNDVTPMFRSFLRRI